MDYKLLVDFEALDFVASLQAKDRRLLRDAFLRIQRNPRKHSDYTETDDAGRLLDVHLAGRFTIKFWEDHADGHLKILDVHFADEAR